VRDLRGGRGEGFARGPWKYMQGKLGYRPVKKLNSQRVESLPNAFQVHGSDLHHILLFFRLQNSVTATTSHARYVEELGAVYHMII
jgi:hypothetical protein